MTSRQTRRQAAQAARRASPSDDDSQAVLANGNGKAPAPAAPDAADQENIFLFWPNIIGTPSQHIVASLASVPASR